MLKDWLKVVRHSANIMRLAWAVFYGWRRVREASAAGCFSRGRRPQRKLLLLVWDFTGGGQQKAALNVLKVLRREFPEWARVIAGGQEAPGSVEMTGDLAETQADLEGTPGARMIRLPSLTGAPDRLADEVIYLLDLFLTENPALIDIRSGSPIAAKIAAAMVGVPVVIHTTGGQDFRRGYPAFVEKLISGLTTAYLHNSESGRRGWIRAGVGSLSQHQVFFHGFDLTPYQHPDLRDRALAWRDRHGIPRDEVIIAGAGRYHVSTGFSVLLRAFAKLSEQRGRELMNNVRLMIVGGAPLNRPRTPMEIGVRQLAAELGISDRVYFVPWQDERDVAAMYAAADVFALSSLWGGVAGTLVRAMAAGVPVVAFDIGGTRDVLQHGQSGIVVPAGDAQALAGGIRRCLDDPKMARAYAERARTTAGLEFGLETMRHRIGVIYRNCLRENGRTASLVEPLPAGVRR